MGRRHRGNRSGRDPLISALVDRATAIIAYRATGAHRSHWDLMEEFRPIIGDSVVIGLINNGEITAKDLVSRGGAWSLTPEGKRTFLMAYDRRMDQLVTHPLFGYAISYRRILEVQVRLLGRHLFGELAEYPQFLVR